MQHSPGVKYKHLCDDERYQIATLKSLNYSVADIGRKTGRNRSTIHRELSRNADTHDGRYRASRAIMHANARKNRARRNLRYNEEDFGPIEALIKKDFSPEQIHGRLKLEGKTCMSHETIYKWIWMDKKNGGSLWIHLRGAQKQRRKRYSKKDSRGRLAGKKTIEQRPIEVEKRERIGDWEIDTVHGNGSSGGVVTIVERASGLVRIGQISRINKQETTARTINLLKKSQFPVHTITADNGSEFHGYKKIEKSLNTEVFFANPHHSWERGTNENTNGLIRQYIPKSMSCHDLKQSTCTAIEKILNNRPRKRLGFRTPLEVFQKSNSVALQI